MKLFYISWLFILLSITYAKRHGLESQNRGLVEEDSKILLNWGDNDNSFGDWIGDKIDDITDGISDWWNNITDGIDWGNLDWGDFDWGDFDWGDYDWNKTSWDEFLSDLDFGETDIDFCSILELAVGLGSEFSIEGNCDCNGNLTSGISIDCSFDNKCVGICASVDLHYDTGDKISAGACVDYESDEYPEVCYTYSYDITGESGQSCVATYGGNECGCEIQDFCLAIDCSMYLPGASLDTCQLLETITGDDITSFLPDFPVFGEDFKQYFEDIPWETLDWENLDWDNFDVNNIEYGSVSPKSVNFGDIISTDETGNGLVCSVLQKFIGMDEGFSSNGGCTCNQDESGFKMGCSFENNCASEDLCASIDFDFGYTDLATVESGVCVNFANDGHPETCFTYSIPIVDDTSLPECTATYDGKACLCSIDENFCLDVDCSEHEPTAVTATCQNLSLDGVESFILDFPPKSINDDKQTDEGTDENTEDTKDEDTNEDMNDNGSLTNANKLVDSGVAHAVPSAFAVTWLAFTIMALQ